MTHASTFALCETRDARELRLLLSRYTKEIELDLAFHTSYRLSMFGNGQEKLITLANLVSGFRRMRTSFLHAAMMTDVELYERSVDGPELPPAPPDFIDETSGVALLRTISEQLQALAHYAARQKGAPKIRKLPRPVSARDAFMRREGSRQFASLEAKFKFVSNEEYAENVRRRQEEGGTGG